MPVVSSNIIGFGQHALPQCNGCEQAVTECTSPPPHPLVRCEKKLVCPISGLFSNVIFFLRKSFLMWGGRNFLASKGIPS